MNHEPRGQAPVYVRAPVSSIEHRLNRIDKRLSDRLGKIEDRLGGVEKSVWKHTGIITAVFGVLTPMVVLFINWLLTR